MCDDERTGNPAAGMEQDAFRAEGSESMTNLQILNEIEKLFEANEGDLDTAKLDAYLSILQERDPVMEDYDPNQAWEVFKKNNASLFEEDAADTMAEQAKVPDQRTPRFRRWIGGIAAAAAMLCMVTFVSNASFRAWVRDAYEGSFIYRFFNDETPDTLPDYEITALPEGYTLYSHNVSDTSGIKIYSFGDTKIGFMYCYMSNGYTKIFSGDEVKYSDTKVQVHEITANFYTADAENAPNELVWIDEQTNILFELSAYLDQNEMIKMAESVSIYKP